MRESLKIRHKGSDRYEYLNWIFSILIIFLVILCNGCINKGVQEANEKSDGNENPTKQDIFSKEESVTVFCLNTVSAHNEEELIIGKFNGEDRDTLYVVVDNSGCYGIDPVTNEEHVMDPNAVKYYAKSNNPNIPQIELYGSPDCMPLLVYEGDLDGNGTDEWGYLHTGTNSQWRQYRVFTLKNGKWCHLIYDSLLDTSEEMRNSGYEILESGPKPGLVKVNYIPNPFASVEVKDTLLTPTFTPITSKTY